MTKKVFSCSFSGLQCQIIEVEADISQGMPAFNIVGLGDTSVQESKERVRSSIKNSEAQIPSNKKTINLAPAEVKKIGSLFDLPIAASILLASNQIKEDKLNNALLVGELALSGKIKKINGALALTQHAKEKGFTKIFLPQENALEASFIDDIEIYPLENLKQLIQFCNGEINIEPQPLADFRRIHQNLKNNQNYDLKSIIGLEEVKRALSIAAAGGHNVLLNGPPGTGKTVLARAFSELVPEMSKQEILETTKIFSIAGLTQADEPLIVKRPFREVHHTASLVSVIGGGALHPQPGEISLAHNGVLFFDEIVEFPIRILEALRQPLEDKYININRANFSVKFPCNFIFIATMNPCPCGYFNDPKISCICTAKQIENYQKRLSGPILDRFDIFLTIQSFSLKNIFEDQASSKDQEILDKITQAKEIQNQRFQSLNIKRNSDLTIKTIQQHCSLKKEAKDILDIGAERLKLSNRGYLRILKVARTIADLEQNENIKADHIKEALQYRQR